MARCSCQRVRAVRPEIIVEIPETRLQTPERQIPTLGCSGAQPLCRAFARPDRGLWRCKGAAAPPAAGPPRGDPTREAAQTGRPEGRLGQGQHGLDAFADHEDVVMRGQPEQHCQGGDPWHAAASRHPLSPDRQEPARCDAHPAKAPAPSVTAAINAGLGMLRVWPSSRCQHFGWKRSALIVPPWVMPRERR